MAICFSRECVFERSLWIASLYFSDRYAAGKSLWAFFQGHLLGKQALGCSHTRNDSSHADGCPRGQKPRLTICALLLCALCVRLLGAFCCQSQGCAGLCDSSARNGPLGRDSLFGVVFSSRRTTVSYVGRKIAPVASLFGFVLWKGYPNVLYARDGYFVLPD